MSNREARVGVFLADDHPIFREGLRRVIKQRPDLELLGVAAHGRDALEGIQETQPDVAVLDMKMPGLRGAQVLQAIKRDGARTEILFLSAYAESTIVYDVLALGAKGYLSKLADPDSICEAIRRIARGDVVLDDDVQSALATEITQRRLTDERPRLTARESEVLRLIGDGNGNSTKAIGEQLHITPATVKGHLQTLYEKLGVSDRASAVAEAMRRQLLE